MTTVSNSFVNLENVLNRTRVAINDAYNNGAGEVLTDSSPFTLPYVNSALAELQYRLGNNAEAALYVDNYIVSGLELIGSTNPALQTNLSVNGYSGYTNTFTISTVQVASNVVTVTIPGGTTGLVATMPVVISGLSVATYLNGVTLTISTVTSTTFTAPYFASNSGPTSDSGLATNTLDPTLALPVDLLIPEFLWERQTGSNLPFHPMRQPQEGLQSRLQSVALHEWEWRDNAIYFIGAQTQRDVRIRYRRLEANLPAGTVYSNVSVDLPGSSEALAYLIAYYYDETRSPENAAIFLTRAEYHIMQMIKRGVRQRQGIEYRRRQYGNTGNRTRSNNRIL